MSNNNLNGYNDKGEIIFEDYPDFRPNLTPHDIFARGSFGGTYWRPIISGITGESYRNRHLLCPNEWWSDIADTFLIQSQYDESINRYGVKVGSTLEEWETKGWISAQDPYGWVEWYCHFYAGRRSKDDKRQIRRWKRLTGQKGRFKAMLISLIKRNKTTYDDYTVSPKIRQTLQHWAYELKPHDLR